MVTGLGHELRFAMHPEAYYVGLRESCSVHPCAGHVASNRAGEWPLNHLAAELGRWGRGGGWFWMVSHPLAVGFN